MKKTLLLLIVALLIVVQTSPFALGATYHASDCIDKGLPGGADSNCEVGDDSRSAQEAQNPDTPWKTAGKLKDYYVSNGMCGDQFLMARGGSFARIEWPEKAFG
jgi:hypothetical protein